MFLYLPPHTCSYTYLRLIREFSYQRILCSWVIQSSLRRETVSAPAALTLQPGHSAAPLTPTISALWSAHPASVVNTHPDLQQQLPPVTLWHYSGDHKQERTHCICCSTSLTVHKIQAWTCDIQYQSIKSRHGVCEVELLTGNQVKWFSTWKDNLCELEFTGADQRMWLARWWILMTDQLHLDIHLNKVGIFIPFPLSVPTSHLHSQLPLLRPCSFTSPLSGWN